MPQNARKPIAHFIGIGGIGMSALARWFLAQNWAVSGSDIKSSTLIKELAKEGVKIKIGHRKANVPPGTVMVIHSEAIPPLNPEFLEARRRAIKPLSYSQTIGCLTRVYRTLAVTGSHGKSTTTAILSLMLIKAGFDPNVIVGTTLKEFGDKNFRFGKSKWLVLEADDYKAVFLNYLSQIAIATTLDREHLDVYKNLGNIKRAFLKFFENVAKGGALILNRDDKNIFSLRSSIARIAKRKSITVYWYGLRQKEARLVKGVMGIPGAHNVSNALAAFTAATKVLKIKKSIALKAAGSYRGAWRRMEYRGKFILRDPRYAIRVYDDYAHHPTEIKVTLAAFRERFPKNPIICVYQPHQVKRLTALFKEFQSSFTEADTVFLLPVYEVAGRDQKTSRLDSRALARGILRKHPKKLIFYLENPRNIKKAITTLLKNDFSYKPLPSPILIMMGAGSIVDYTPLLLK